MSTPGDGSHALADELDGEQLLRSIGIDDREIDRRKAFTGFDETDANRLVEHRHVFEDVSRDLVERFYDHLQSHEGSRDVLDRSSRSIESLKETQRQYLVGLSGGTYDRSYFAERARIGKVHELLDMDPHLYLGAYTIYYEGIVDALAEDVKGHATSTDGGSVAVASGDGAYAESVDGAVETVREEVVSAAVDDAVETIHEQSDLQLDDEELDEIVADSVSNGANGTLESAIEGAVESAVEDVVEDVVEETVEESVGEAVDELADTTVSTLRLLSLDQQVAMDTYIDSYADLESEIQRRRAVAEDLRESIDGLREEIATVTDQSTEADGITDEQSAQMAEVADEVANLSATVEEIASTANQVEASSSQAEMMAEEGRESAVEAIEAMEDVDESADEVSEDVERLQERVAEIDEIVEVINDIADQTNLLALNASIEAARAGEAGEGFAVVADEVKNLAEESQQQAGRIEEMIAEIQADTENTVGSLADTNRQISRGIDRVEGAMHNLEEIVDAVEETAEGIQEVSNATDDQASSTEQVATMVDSVARRASEVNSIVSEISAASDRQLERIESVADIAESLEDSEA